MNITTKFNIGDLATVKQGDRPVHLPEDENNRGKIIEVSVSAEKGKPLAISYLMEFNDPDTGKPDPDWNEEYEEDMLEGVK